MTEFFRPNRLNMMFFLALAVGLIAVVFLVRETNGIVWFVFAVPVLLGTMGLRTVMWNDSGLIFAIPSITPLGYGLTAVVWFATLYGLACVFARLVRFVRK